MIKIRLNDLTCICPLGETTRCVAGKFNLDPDNSELSLRLN